MLRKIQFQNVRCLRDVTVELEPLTVFLGLNDAGKSSLVQAIKTFWRTLRSPLTVLPGQPADARFDLSNVVWKGKHSQPIRWKAELEMPNHRTFAYILRAEWKARGLDRWELFEHFQVDGDPLLDWAEDTRPAYYAGRTQAIKTTRAVAEEEDENYGYTFLSKVKKPQSQERFRPEFYELAEEFDGYRAYHLDFQSLRQPSILELEKIPVLSPTGKGLPSVLDWMLHEHRDCFLELEQSICRMNPTLGGIALPLRKMTNSRGEMVAGRGIEFHQTSHRDRKIPASLVSEGVMKMLGYMTLLHHPYRPNLLILEEPDAHIHPLQFEALMQKLQALTQETDEHGLPACQVILTTQNPQVLNYVDNRQIRVLTRDEEGATQVSPFVTDQNLEKMLQLMSRVRQIMFRKVFQIPNSQYEPSEPSML